MMTTRPKGAERARERERVIAEAGPTLLLMMLLMTTMMPFQPMRCSRSPSDVLDDCQSIQTLFPACLAPRSGASFHFDRDSTPSFVTIKLGRTIAAALFSLALIRSPVQPSHCLVLLLTVCRESGLRRPRESPERLPPMS